MQSLTFSGLPFLARQDCGYIACHAHLHMPRPAAGFRPPQAEWANGIVACQLRFVDGSQSLSQPSGSPAAVDFGTSGLTAITGFGSSGTGSNVTLGNVGRIACGMIVFVAKIKA